MLISIARARAALGAAGAGLSDDQIRELSRGAEAVARWLERRVDEQDKERQLLPTP